MNALPDFTGQRFGRLLVVQYVGIDKRHNRSYECKCDCGKTIRLAAAVLKAGQQSCGCLQIERATETLRAVIERQVVHGMSGTLTYISWAAMIARCFDYRRPVFGRYGAKGITACKFLAESPKNLLAVVGERPGKEFTLDRKDCKGHYSCGSCDQCKGAGWPTNVRWATAQQQACNRKNNVWITINGIRKTRSQWAEHLGMSYRKACHHLKKHEVSKDAVRFRPVDGIIPEGKREGEIFDAACQFIVESDGKICLLTVNGVTMSLK